MAQHYDPFSAMIPNSRAYEQGKFGRLFPWLPPLAEDTPKVRAELIKLAEVIHNTPRPSGNMEIPAGYTYLGQFIIHDISFDPTSINERQVDPEFLWNFRTPALDLDSVYGGGPKVVPYLYDSSQNLGATHFLTGEDHKNASVPFFDVPRLDTPNRKIAVIADPRNDEHVIISQLHLAFMLLHNMKANNAKENGTNGDEAYRMAKQEVRWLYQWVLLYDFLPIILDLDAFNDEIEEGKLDDKLNGQPENIKRMNKLISKKDKFRKYYDWRNEPYIPLEFSAAAFRFGHSMVLDTYRFNNEVDDSLFGHTGRGANKSAFTYIDWSFFFPENGTSTVRWTTISPSLTGKLKNMVDPAFRAKGDEQLDHAMEGFRNGVLNREQLRGIILDQGMMVNERDLAARNLIRGLMLKLPSGQSVARAMGLEPEDMGRIPEIFVSNTPLWYYILKEAEGKNSLGQVGSRIVGEVIIGLIQGDKSSFLNQFPKWLPEKIANNPHLPYTMADLLKEAGVYKGAIAK